MNFEMLTFGGETVKWIVMAVIGVYSWIIGRQSASAKELLELRVQLTALEVKVNELPTTREMSKMAARLERIDSRIDGIAESIQPVSRSLERINDYLMKNK